MAALPKQRLILKTAVRSRGLAISRRRFNLLVCWPWLRRCPQPGWRAQLTAPEPRFERLRQDPRLALVASQLLRGIDQPTQEAGNAVERAARPAGVAVRRGDTQRRLAAMPDTLADDGQQKWPW